MQTELNTDSGFYRAINSVKGQKYSTVWRTYSFSQLAQMKDYILPTLTTSLIHFSLESWENLLFELGDERVNPFTPKSDQCQISPAASPEILHHTVRRTWLFITYSDEKWLYYKFSLPHLYIFSLKGWENVLFELGRESTVPLLSHTLTSQMLAQVTPWPVWKQERDQCQISPPAPPEILHHTVRRT